MALNGSFAESPVGYRRMVSVDFEPLQDNKQALFFLFSWCIAKIKYITYYTNYVGQVVNPSAGTANSIQVAFLNEDLSFEHEKNALFANAFTLEMVEEATNYNVDDGSVRILKPIYSPIGTGVAGNTFTCYANLVDQSSIGIFKTQFRYIHGVPESRDFGYHHALTLDTGLLSDAGERQWVRDFLLRQNKQIDTTAIDPYNGKVFDVVFAGEKLEWRSVQGLSEAKATTLVFKEKSLRTTPERYVSMASNEHDFTLDSDQLDDTNSILGAN
jgi:hypothetical protein